MGLFDSLGALADSVGGSLVSDVTGMATQTGWGQLASTGLQIGADIYNGIESNKVAGKRNAALYNSYLIQQASLNKRVGQVQQGANQQVSLAESGAQTQIARARAISGEYGGGGGNSADRSAYVANFTGDQNINSIRTNEQNTVGQLNMQGYSDKAAAIAGQSVGTPWLATAFQIGGAVAGYASKFPTTPAPTSSFNTQSNGLMNGLDLTGDFNNLLGSTT